MKITVFVCPLKPTTSEKVHISTRAGSKARRPGCRTLLATPLSVCFCFWDCLQLCLLYGWRAARVIASSLWFLNQ